MMILKNTGKASQVSSNEVSTVNSGLSSGEEFIAIATIVDSEVTANYNILLIRWI